MDLRKFKQAFGRPFVEAGFRHKGQTWFLDTGEATVLANLQRDQYSPLFFLNLGFWLKAVSPAAVMPPPEHLCHVRIRAEGLYPDLGAEMTELLNPETKMSDQQREIGFQELLIERVVPFLKSGATLSGLREQIVRGRFRSGLVHVRAKKVLGIQ